MNYFKYTLAILLIFQISCRGSQKELSDIEAIYEVDVDNLKSGGVAPMSSYFKSVSPIILETSENNLIKSIDIIQTTDDYIFILDRQYKRLHCYNKKGKFVRMIGSVGNGPGEYNNISDFTINESDKLIFLLDNYTLKIHVYKFTGEHVNTINISNSIDGACGHIQYNNGHLFTDYQPAKSKQETTPLLMKFDVNSGEFLSEHLSSEIYNLGFQLITFKNNSYFYSKNSSSSFYTPIYSPIVFSIENNVLPYFKIESKRVLKKEEIEGYDLSVPGVISEINSLDKIKSILFFSEIGDYIICEYSDGYYIHTIVFSKTSKEVNLYAGFFDDFVYKNFKESIPHYFACTDNNGMYAYMNINDIPLFIDYYKIGNIKLTLDQFEIDAIQDLSDDANPLLFYYTLGNTN